MARLGTFRPALCLTLFASLALLAVPTPVLAGCEPDASFFDWNRCWSGSRVGLYLLGLPLTWVLIFHVWPFPWRISARNPAAPWPRTSLGRSLADWWLVNALSLLTLFAVVSDELRVPLAATGQWGVPIGLSIVALVGYWVIRQVIRHRA